jgi:UDP-N-acetylmuramoyl-tripeptide--D-alanyl-D-alanine ligase
MQRVRLAELLQGVGFGFISNRRILERTEVDSISTDTRSLKRGDLFLAIPGAVHDGHAFIGDAFGRGASGVIFETARYEQVRPHLKPASDRLLIGVDDTRRVFGSMASNYLRKFRVQKIALTGSAGKTTTKELIHAVLSRRYRVVANVQSYNNDIGVPKTLLGVDDSTRILVQEIGTNHPGEIAYLAGMVEPDCGLITNIGPAHIEFFGSERRIAREKKALFRTLHARGTAFVNNEDPFKNYLMRGIRARCKRFGLESGDLHPDRIIGIGLEQAEFVIGGVRVRARVLGMHGIRNATAAALIGLHFDLSFEEIAAGLEEFQGLSGRGTVFIRGGATIIDESYNANPLSVRASLEYLGALQAAGRKIFVFADMLELGARTEHFHRWIADQVPGKGIDLLFTYGEGARITGRQCGDAVYGGVVHFEEIEDLRERLEEEIREGDLVLVKGSRAMRLERAIRAPV